MSTNEEIFKYAFENDEEFRNDFLDVINASEETREIVNDYFSENDEENVSDEASESIDYSSILSEMNINLQGVSSSIIDIKDILLTNQALENGLLNNTAFIVYFLFGFFICGALIIVIKFLRQFF